MKIQTDPTAVTPAAIGAPTASPRKQDAAKPEAQASSRPTNTAATVDLSPRSRELHEALVKAKAAPDVRAQVVEQIRQRLDAGTYVVDPSSIAQSILDRRA
jgi:flagellar biosynthesis anti-sigma factor FlgM